MILVPGASGFLGIHLLKELSKNGVPVRALYHTAKDLPKFPNVEWVSCNLLDIPALEDAMQGISHIYNCAASVSFDPKDKQAVLRNNVAITANLVNLALDLKVEKFVHVSSTAALGRDTDHENGKSLINEASNYVEESKANSKYAYGKYLSELEIWRGAAEGLNMAIINPGIILGAGNWDKGSAKLMKICYEEFPWFTTGKTAWVAVQDVVKAMILLMESRISDKRFILSENNYSYQEIFALMANAVGKKPPHKPAGPFLSGLVWRWSVLKSKILRQQATITKETARAAQSTYLYDASEFLKTFPEFHYTPIQETITQMGKQFLKDISDS